MHEYLRQRLLGGWAGLISRRAGWVVLIATALALAAIAVTVGQLRFQSNRNDLIDPNLPWNQRFIRWTQTFTGNSDFTIAIDTYRDGKPNPDQARKAVLLADELGEELQRQEEVLDVLWRFDPSQAQPRAARLLPMDQFRQRLEQAAQARPLLTSPTPQALIQQAVEQMRQPGGQAASTQPTAQDLEQFQLLLDAFTQRMQTPAEQPMDLMRLIEGEPAPWQYLTTDNGRFLILRVRPREDRQAISAFETAIDSVRQVMAQVGARHPDVEMGLTGIDVIENDETAAAMSDSTIASVIATAVIATLLILAFQSFRVPLLLIVSLLIGIAWSFGFLTLTIGHLQVISVVFVTMLLGLGVAFGIHIASRYELIRHRYPDTFEGFREALADTLVTIGPGVVTGAVTTAAAFCTTMLTDFRGVAEMGAIAGAGILLCLIAMTSVFPALLRIFKPNHKHLVRMEHRFIHIFEERWVMPFAHHPRWTLAGTMVVAGLSLAAITQMRFDYNLLELLPTGVDSVEWYRRIEAQGEQSVWSSVSIAPSLEEARERAQRFRALGTVGMVRGIGELFPEDEPEKLAAMAPVRAGLADALEQALAEEAPATQTAGPATQPDLVTQLTGLRLLFGLARGQLPPELGPQLASLEQSLDRFLQAAASLAPDERAARLQALQRDYQTWRREVARQIAGMLDPSPLQPNDLPPRLLSPYIATDENGQTLYALEIHPALPAGVEDVLDPRFLGRFIQELKSVDPAITGVVVQIYESGELIWKSYLQAGIYALIAVFVLVWFDFQSLRDALLSLAPVAAGFAVTFAVMYLVGMQINPANIVVLPLMFGIGVDAGVHILHRYRQDPTHRPLGLTAGTGKGITLTSYTTMVGFGSLLIAHHRGIAGLGFVLMTGIGLTLLACWTLMPAWLELRAARTPSAQAAAQRGTSHS